MWKFIQIGFGLSMIFYPKLFANIEAWHNKYFLTISNDKINWKLSYYETPVELKLEDIESFVVYIGETHFKTKKGGKYILKTHRVHNRQKHEELISIFNKKMAF